MTTTLLLIDPQIDFCCPERGSLFVSGADQDMERLAKMVATHSSKIDSITVTLDTHHAFDIAHPMFWVDESGAHPTPFTLISESDVASGQWRAAVSEMQDRSAEYVRALQREGRYTLCIWPYHCLIGSEGHSVEPTLFKALREWEEQCSIVNYVTKGTNSFTEHYSAIRAEVPDPSDPSTHVNLKLIANLWAADRVLVAGEAGSHCVANTVRDLVIYMGSDASKLTLLTDAMSAVTGFESLQTSFFEDMERAGLGFETTETIF